jgi:hypothetical protein
VQHLQSQFQECIDGSLKAQVSEDTTPKVHRDPLKSNKVKNFGSTSSGETMRTYTGEAQVHTQQLASKAQEGCTNEHGILFKGKTQENKHLVRSSMKSSITVKDQRSCYRYNAKAQKR